MIKSFYASTCEIDDAQAAVAEIKAALDLEKNLLKNSLGIISCFSEFAETGVLQEICGALPFDCVGATSCLCSAGGKTDQIIFTITVLTSDDCSFKTTAVPIDGNYKNSVASAISGLLEGAGEHPKLFLSYFPMISAVSGDMILTEIDGASGGVPLFGTVSVDHTMDYSTAQTILNGTAYLEAAVLCAVYGNPEFSFEIASLDENKVSKQKAIITASDGNILMGVNGMNAMDYLEEIGLSRAELARGLGIIPLVVDHKDGTRPVARGVFGLTPEGYAVCGGSMPTGTTLAIGRIDMNDVLSTTEKTLAPFIENDKDSFVLGYSCMSRYLSLGANSTAEAEKVAEITGGLPYHFACSGGEICPHPDKDGRLRNFFHNHTIVFCKLK